MLWLIRVAIHVSVSLVLCRGHRSDDNDREMTLIPLGTLVLIRDSKTNQDVGHAIEHFRSAPHDTEGSGAALHGMEHEALLQRSWTSDSMVAAEGGNHAASDASAGDPPKTVDPSPKGTETADAKIARDDGRKKEAKCNGKGDGWQCLWKDKQNILKNNAENNGADCKSGHECMVGCDEPHEFHPKKAKVKCNNGKYEELPECIKHIQCPPTGGGWKCQGVDEKKDMVNAGDKCHVECLEPGFHPSVAETTCSPKATYEPAPTCVQSKHCPSSGEGWKCGDGTIPTPSDKDCKVTCEEEGDKPEEATVKCGPKDGKYVKEPKCDAPKKSGAVQLRFSKSLIALLLIFLCKSDLHA